MSIGTMRCVAINVTDFAVGYEFWSAVTGYEILGPEHGWHGWLGYLGTTEPRKHEMILINTDTAPIQTEATDPPPNQSGPHRHHPQRRCRCRHRTDPRTRWVREEAAQPLSPPGNLWRRCTGHRLGGHAGPVRQRVLSRPRPHRRTIRSGHARRRDKERPTTTNNASPLDRPDAPPIYRDVSPVGCEHDEEVAPADVT